MAGRWSFESYGGEVVIQAGIERRGDVGVRGRLVCEETWALGGEVVARHGIGTSASRGSGPSSAGVGQPLPDFHDAGPLPAGMYAVGQEHDDQFAAAVHDKRGAGESGVPERARTGE